MPIEVVAEGTKVIVIFRGERFVIDAQEAHSIGLRFLVAGQKADHVVR